MNDNNIKEESSVIFVPKTGDVCINLLNSSVEENSYQIIDKMKPTSGLIIYEKEINNPFQVLINCNKELDKPTYETLSNGLKISSKKSCGIVNEAARVFFNNKYLFSLVFMVIGTILMVFGGYKWDYLLVGVGFFSGFTFVFFLFWAFVSYDQRTQSYVIISIVAIIVGAILGYICKIFDFISYFSIGFLGGFFLSKFLFVTFPISSMEDWVVIFLTYVCAFAAGVTCIFIGKYFMVIITAVIGAFLFWYNFGFMINALPNMFDFFDQFKTYGKMSSTNIIFLVLAGLTALGFTVLQYKLIAREKSKEQKHLDEKNEILL